MGGATQIDTCDELADRSKNVPLYLRGFVSPPRTATAQQQQVVYEQHVQVAIGYRAGISDCYQRFPGLRPHPPQQRGMGHGARRANATHCSEHDAHNDKATDEWPAKPLSPTTNLPTTVVDNNNQALIVRAGKQYTERDNEWGCGSPLRLALLGRQVSAPGDAAALVGLVSTRSAHDCPRAYQSQATIGITVELSHDNANTFITLQGSAFHNTDLSPWWHDIDSTTDHVKLDVPDNKTVTCITKSQCILADTPATSSKQDHQIASLSLPDIRGIATTRQEHKVLTTPGAIAYLRVGGPVAKTAGIGKHIVPTLLPPTGNRTAQQTTKP